MVVACRHPARRSGEGSDMSEKSAPGGDLGPTASIITIGDEIVEGRVLNENATWLSDELMTRGVWPRLVVAVPDVASMIVSVVRVAADAADLVFVTGGLGFTPDDITRHAVATAFFRDVQVDNEVARRFRSRNTWADERIATAAATFPVDAAPLETTSGGVPGFQLRNAYVLPGVPAEMRSMFRALKFSVECEPIHRTVLTVPTTEDRIRRTLEQFAVRHPAVRLGSYPGARARVAVCAEPGRGDQLAEEPACLSVDPPRRQPGSVPVTACLRPAIR
jgi:molybdenum cofactor synthesis domain-containing protein